MKIEDFINLLEEFYNVQGSTDLAAKMGVTQQTVSNWKTRNSVNAIKKKCKQLNIYNEIFNDINQNLNINHGINALNNYGTQEQGKDTNSSIDNDILKIIKSAEPIFKDDENKKNDFINHLKKWIVSNL